MTTRPFTADIARCCEPLAGAIGDVVRCIDRAAIGIALLVDQDRRLVATVTDGDVRRAMLAGIDFAQPCARLLEMKKLSAHPVPVSRSAHASDEELLHAMRDAQVQHIPLLDDDGRVVDVVLLDHLVDARENDVSAVVMAGGFGARLRPFTDATPKPMLPVGDKPLLERTIHQLRGAGITEVNITTHYLHDKIADHFGTGSGFGVNVNYVREDRPLGTAGALGLIARPQSTMLVINGDILTTIDFRAMTGFHRANAADLTVAVRLYEIKVPYGVVDCAGVRVTGVREKPSERYFVSAGIYLVEPRVWDFITGGEPLDMPQVIERVIGAGGSVVSFPLREYWLDIGRPDDYRRAQEDVEAGRLAP
jgi:dTDP-glucose pyrophosphorylase